MSKRKDGPSTTPSVILELCRTVQQLADRQSIDTPLIDEQLTLEDADADDTQVSPEGGA